MEEGTQQKKTYTPHQAKLKVEAYCAYQERAQQEVRDKLYTYGLHQEEVESILADLICDNFLNEERFAKAYALGKFRIKGWGKIKIKQALKLKRVPEKLIQIALKEIPLDEYYAAVATIIERKVNDISTLLNPNEKAKLIRFLYGRGFEQDLIYEAIHEQLAQLRK